MITLEFEPMDATYALNLVDVEVAAALPVVDVSGAVIADGGVAGCGGADPGAPGTDLALGRRPCISPPPRSPLPGPGSHVVLALFRMGVTSPRHGGRLHGVRRYGLGTLAGGLHHSGRLHGEQSHGKPVRWRPQMSFPS